MHVVVAAHVQEHVMLDVVLVRPLLVAVTDVMEDALVAVVDAVLLALAVLVVQDVQVVALEVVADVMLALDALEVVKVSVIMDVVQRQPQMHIII